MKLLEGLHDRLSKIGFGIKKDQGRYRQIGLNPLVALDSTRPFIGVLPPELLIEVLKYVDDTHQASMKQMSLTCTTFYHLAREIAGISIALDLTVDKDKEARTKAILKWHQLRGNLTKIRTIRISNTELYCYCPQCRTTSPASFEPTKDIVPSTVYLLQGLLPHMSSLREVYWLQEAWSHLILDVLKQNPRVQLIARNGRTKDSRRYIHQPWTTPVDVSQLISLDILTSLEFTGAYSGRACLLGLTQPLRQILLTCRYLKSLIMDIQIVQCACTMPSQPFQYSGFGFIEGERPAALEKFELRGYPFHLMCLAANGYPGVGPEQKDWANNFDWTRLKDLHSFDVMFASHVASKLTVVESVSLEELPWENDTSLTHIRNFYRDIPTSLRRLQVQRLGYLDDEDVFRHGTSLRELEIHAVERRSYSWKSEAVKAPFLYQLRDRCPNIESLEIDLFRSDSWPFKELEIICSFPKLKRLTVWVELGVTQDIELIQPLMTFDAAKELFRFCQRRAGTCFREMNIKSGSQHKVYPRHYYGKEYWPIHNSAVFHFKLSDKDDEAIHGKHTVTCKGLPEEYNQLLRGEISEQQLEAVLEKQDREADRLLPRRKKSQRRMEARWRRRAREQHADTFAVAKNGPVPRDQWVNKDEENCVLM